MEITLYILLFAVGLFFFICSTRQNEYDISNTYQVITSFLSLVIFAVLAFASFNIEIVHFWVIAGVATTVHEQIADMTYFGINLALMIFSLLNIIVIFTWGNFNNMFRLNQRRDE